MKYKLPALIIGAMVVCAGVGSAVALKNPLPPAAIANPNQTFPDTVTCEVVYAIDGDTIKCLAPELDTTEEQQTCEINGKKTAGCWNVRLARIDTGETTYEDSRQMKRPRWSCEAEHQSGLKAKFLTQMMIRASGGVLVLKNISDDHYVGRRDAEVWAVGDVNLSDALLTLQLAVEWSPKVTKAKRKKLFCPTP